MIKMVTRIRIVLAFVGYHYESGHRDDFCNTVLLQQSKIQTLMVTNNIILFTDEDEDDVTMNTIMSLPIMNRLRNL